MYDRPEFPDEGILWLRWDETTLDFVAKRNRPILLFVGDANPLVAPTLTAVLRAMPANARLRQLLFEKFPAVLLEATAPVPEELEMLGARERYHIAILSPAGYTPICTIDPFHAEPAAVVEQVVTALDVLGGLWP